MTLTLELSPEIEAQIERAAAEAQTDISSFILAAAAEKAARVFDESKFDALIHTDPLAALDYLLEVTPTNTAPLAEDAIARSYSDYHDEKASA
jgi:uncharacterized protein (DUF1778 family)